MEWPTHFPPACPPVDAECKSITVYRFLDDDDDVTNPKNFLTVRESSPGRVFKPTEKECRACSLSIFTNKEEAVRLQKAIPRWRKPFAEGELDIDSGKIKHTPSPGSNNSHHSWWVPVNIKSWQLFHNIVMPPESQ
jgi:hypothetical protein